MNKTVLLLTLALASATAGAADKGRIITYVGEGRYTCSGNGCQQFNARESQIQYAPQQQRLQQDRNDYNAWQRSASTYDHSQSSYNLRARPEEY